ncbi:MAG: hypothetical protein FVQ83_04580 [Chloroflexi bacterium]|nr:hypothetical protein [Chloroflexota bacterium]
MNSRQRFYETMHYGSPDRVPYFEEGIREGVLLAWRKQGMPRDADLSKMFTSDHQEEISLEIHPLPWMDKMPALRGDLDEFRRLLDPNDSARLPGKWAERVSAWKDREHVLMLRVSRGIFQSMGVGDGNTFTELMRLMKRDPQYVRAAMTIQGEFNARLVARVLSEVHIDAAVFGEAIGANHGALISPSMYEDFALTSYQPILDVLRGHGVDTFIWRTYANARVLIPSILKWGINCLWACEVDLESMDYADLRSEFGRDLRLIGGIDLDTMRGNKDDIRREIETKVPPLVAQGGYVPLADGRVREDMPYENYIYYRQLLEELTQL